MIIHQSGVTIKEAAQLLGISEAAVRQRLLRRTLTSTRQNGRVFVLLPEDMETKSADSTPDDTIPEPDGTPDDMRLVEDNPIVLPLVSQLRDEVAFLRQQVEIKDRQIGELHVLLQVSQRQLPPVVPSTARDNEQESPMQSAPVAPEGVQREIRPSWWRRLFGGE